MGLGWGLFVFIANTLLIYFDQSSYMYIELMFVFVWSHHAYLQLFRRIRAFIHSHPFQYLCAQPHTYFVQCSFAPDFFLCTAHTFCIHHSTRLVIMSPSHFLYLSLSTYHTAFTHRSFYFTICDPSTLKRVSHSS